MKTLYAWVVESYNLYMYKNIGIMSHINIINTTATKHINLDTTTFIYRVHRRNISDTYGLVNFTLEVKSSTHVVGSFQHI